MGALPSARVNPARPFQHTGVDYAGPYWIKTSPGRGHKSVKVFLVVFVCLSTKAVHLDLASNYSTEAFLAEFRRLTARRGLCSDLYSDRGINFVGADAQLRRLFSAASKDGASLAASLANSRVKWHFNPPASPHFGGLWEAAVKSTKHHLRRVIGYSKLTFEEMSTLLAEIEACLNSRPLRALSDDPEDLQALTPGQFLIGSALTAVPEPTLLDTRTSYLNRWQLTTEMRDHFWQRWSWEYLQSLIARSKWHEDTTKLQTGALCL